jgi:murein DD-endopeptidase MepM/ murein hydrolase activator NlpD
MIYPLVNLPKLKKGYIFGQKASYTSRHLGTDYIVVKGTPVYAPTDCEIIVSGVFEQGGNTMHASFVDMKHGKLIMRFMHLSQLGRKGNYKEGEILGYTGKTGKLGNGAHLHLDISKNAVDLKEFNNFIDPEEFFRRVEKVNNMITYQKEGDPKIYALVGNVLIPFDISWETYKAEFENAEIKVLQKVDFDKLKISQAVKIVPK